MKAFVVVATKGRAKETYQLLTYLSKQTSSIEKTIVVGSEDSDIAELDKHPFTLSGNVLIKISQIAGSCIQRNIGLDVVKENVSNLNVKDWCVIFFDDDFRPADNWVDECKKSFDSNPIQIGLTGYLFADGILTDSGYKEVDANAFLTAQVAPQNNSKQMLVETEMDGLYGCNMALRGTFACFERFDEALQLYGWLEDLDFTARASKYGKLFFVPSCKGVHLGVQGGRTSGVKFGYSQIANPIYINKKGSITIKKAYTQLLRNLISNVIKSIMMNRKKDYLGRLKGNSIAFIDILKNDCHPSKIKNLK